MNRRLALTLALVISILVMGLAPTAMAAPASQAADSALLRLVHAVTEAPAVDVLIDGALAASQLAFAENTSYLRLSAGDHSVSVQAGGAPVTEASFSVNPGQAVTAIVMGPAAAPEVMVFEDDLSPLVLGNVRLTATHAVSGADAVDVILPDGSPVLQALAYGNSSGGIDIPANTYPLAVTPTGGTVEQAIQPTTEYHLRAGNFYRLVVLGGGPGTLLLAGPANPSEDSVFVRGAHAIPDAPTVDIYANETLLIPALDSLAITGPVSLPLGSYDISVRASGAGSNEPPIASVTLDLSDAALAGQARTVAAVLKGAAIDLQVYEDDFSELAASETRFAVANAVGGSNLIAELDNGTVVEAGEAFTSAAATETTFGVYELLIASDGGGSFTTDGAFNGGVLYSYLVTGTPDALIVIESEVALNQQPGSVVATSMAAAPVETTAPEVAEAPPEAAAVPTEAPPLPLPTAVPQPVQPASAPADGLLGQVYNLNPGANLQLRQYPRADALSLGLAPGGTLLTVLGRAGEPDFENLPMLEDDEAMDPTQTWLKVTFDTPDGGSITAWAIAQYVQVTEDGERVRLIELDPLPSDVPGEVSGTTVSAPQPSPVSADFYGVVFNINPDANLNIRRTPEVLGEVLVRLPPGTIIEPTGVLQDQSWTFLTYRSEDGGVITGWAATGFIQFVFRGTNYLPNAERINALLQRGVLRITGSDVRGAVSQGTAPAETGGSSDLSQFRNQYIGTTELDPDANLHLRRTPDAAGESLALIPNGGVLIVIGRTSNAEWLQVTYDDVDGWVASTFVDIQINGRPVDLLDVPEVR